jgi:hypothetical protein
VFFPDDIHAQFYAFITDEHGWTRNQLADLVLALAAERAIERALGISARGLGHVVISLCQPGRSMV